MRRSSLFLAAVAFSLSSTLSIAASARDQIRIVGSSTVFPFATAVAEEFGRTTAFKTPIIESTGSGGGLKLFCAGVGVDHPDIANASRRIKQSEVDLCAKNGVTEITEVQIGYDGIVFANSKRAGKRALTLRQVFLALAKEIPAPNGDLIANPNETWKDVGASLPDVKIEVLGPPPTSGTRDAFRDVDAEEARGVLRDDDRIDAGEEAVLSAALQNLPQRAEMASETVDMILIAKQLERVGDHATNIAESVILISEARNVKHAEKLGA